MFIRQPRSPASSRSAPVRSIASAFSSTIAFEIAGYLTQNVPPKPQQTLSPSSGRSSRPSTAASKARGWSWTPSSRSPEQLS